MTESTSRVPELKLIKGGQTEISGQNNRTSAPAQQLPLPFDNSADKLIFIHESELVSESVSTEFLEKFKPQIIFDVRVAPRLDFIASNRALAFQRFRQLNVNYIDVMARAGASSSMVLFESEYWKECINTLSKKSMGDGSFVFIFDDPNTLHAARRTMPSVLQTYSPVP